LLNKNRGALADPGWRRLETVNVRTETDRAQDPEGAESYTSNLSRNLIYGMRAYISMPIRRSAAGWMKIRLA
jgi:hypothetical protein